MNNLDNKADETKPSFARPQTAALLMSDTPEKLKGELASTLGVIKETLRKNGIPLPNATYTNLIDVGNIPPLTSNQFNWLLCYATQLNIMAIETFQVPSNLEYEELFEYAIMHSNKVGNILEEGESCE